MVTCTDAVSSVFGCPCHLRFGILLCTVFVKSSVALVLRQTWVWGCDLYPPRNRVHSLCIMLHYGGSRAVRRGGGGIQHVTSSCFDVLSYDATAKVPNGMVYGSLQLL